ncbi:MAG: hypothetical protein K6F49_03235 [Saccharofermentans sp.]|nr:hypothetical protein [Saccharofermentans sp.]
MKIFIILNILIVLILLLRKLSEGRISPRARYSMWLAIPIYLLISVFAFQAITIRIPRKLEKSIAPYVNDHLIEEDIILGNTYSNCHPISQEDTLLIEAADEPTAEISHSEVPSASPNRTSSPSDSTNGSISTVKIDMKTAGSFVWLCGTILVALFVLTNNIIFLHRIRLSRSFCGRSSYGNLKVYKTPITTSPFLLGNCIYMNRNIKEDSEDYKFAVCHEYCHKKQKDNLWLLAEYIIVCTFWFDPLVWYARKVMREDRELSVDEQVLRLLGTEHRTTYSETLLHFFKNISEDEPLMNITTTMSNRNKLFIKRRIESIMRGTRKSIAATLAISFILSAAVGCTLFKPKSSGEGETISADTPWYECESVECARDYEDISCPSVFQDVIGKTDEGYIYRIQGFYGEYQSEQIYDLALYSESGEKVSSIDLISSFNTCFPEEGNVKNYSSIFGDMYVEDNRVKMVRQSNVDNHIKIYDIDIRSGNITLEHSCETSENWDWYFTNYIYRCGEYLVGISVGYPLKFLIIDPNSDIAEVYSTENETRRDIPLYTTIALAISDHEVLFGDYSNYSIWSFDLESQSLNKIEADDPAYEWIYPYIYQNVRERNRAITGFDGAVYFLSLTELVKMNPDTKEIELITKTENIDINLNLLAPNGRYTCNIAEASNDQIVFCINRFNSGFTVYKASLADQNPNAGKIVITTDGTDPSVYDAIYLFNRTDDDYFVRMVPYKYDDLSDSYYTDSDSFTYETAYYYMADSGNQMMVDLIAGDCPDVVFYASWYSQLNNKNCMYDLTELYNASDLSNSVFDNIVSACKTNDGLFCFPLYYTICGITVDQRSYDYNGYGMTFDDYYDFTYGYCNGTNILGMNQSQFMDICLQNSLDLYLTSDTIDLDNEYFRNIAEYTSVNISNSDLDTYLTSTSQYSTNITSHGQWIDYLNSNHIPVGEARIVGYPSPDGRGLAANICTGASITQGCSCPEGAWRFICLLCNTDIQKLECLPEDIRWDPGRYFPINRSAFDMVAVDFVDRYNTEKREYYENMGIHDVPVIELEEVEILEDAAASIDHIMASDSDIELIIYEEMQAYYAGDKTLDEVIAIINDRVRIAMSERA